MKKILLVITGFVFIISCSLTAAYAKDIAGKSGLGIGLGYISPTEDDVDPGMISNINYTRGINSNLSIEISFGRTVLDIEDDGTIDLGEITVMPLQLTAQYRISSGKLSPYCGAGIGYYFNDFDTSNEAVAFWRLLTGDPGDTFKVEIDNSFGFHINAGVDYFLKDNFAIGLDARYLWSEADITIKYTAVGIPGSDSDEGDIDSFVIGAGIKYFF